MDLGGPCAAPGTMLICADSNTGNGRQRIAGEWAQNSEDSFVGPYAHENKNANTSLLRQALSPHALCAFHMFIDGVQPRFFTTTMEGQPG